MNNDYNFAQPIDPTQGVQPLMPGNTGPDPIRGLITATVFKLGAMTVANIISPNNKDLTITQQQFGNTSVFDIF